MEFNLKRTLEALLFSTAEPIGLKELTKVFERYRFQLKEASEIREDSEETLPEAVPAEVDTQQIRAALSKLISDAEYEDKMYRVVEGPNGYQMVTAPQFAEFVRLLRDEPQPMKLSPAALETLSIVAYRQPVTRAEIEAIRGVSVDGPLNRLIESEMIRVDGRAELPGRPIQYGTTDQFLEFVGIRDLAELPASDLLSHQQIDDWLQHNAGSRSALNDKDVGFSADSDQYTLALSQNDDGESSWRMENIESDAAANN